VKTIGKLTEAVGPRYVGGQAHTSFVSLPLFLVGKRTHLLCHSHSSWWTSAHIFCVTSTLLGGQAHTSFVSLPLFLVGKRTHLLCHFHCSCKQPRALCGTCIPVSTTQIRLMRLLFKTFSLWNGCLPVEETVLIVVQPFSRTFQRPTFLLDKSVTNVFLISLPICLCPLLR
jgi:hypothetical protein